MFTYVAKQLDYTIKIYLVLYDIMLFLFGIFRDFSGYFLFNSTFILYKSAGFCGFLRVFSECRDSSPCPEYGRSRKDRKGQKPLKASCLELPRSVVSRCQHGPFCEKRRSIGDSVIPGWCVSTRPQMCDCTSGNLEIPGSMLRIAPE